jgi:ABC-2 type transport system permease protein
VLLNLPITLSWLQGFLYIILVFNALIFLYAINLIVATLSFWTTQSYGIGRILDNLFKIGRSPLDIFEGFWRAIFIYFFPLVVIAQIPSQALLKILSLKSVFFAFMVSGVSLIIAIKFWRIGIKNYLSAST